LEWGLDDLRVARAAVDLDDRSGAMRITYDRDLVARDTDLSIQHRQVIEVAGSGDLIIDEQLDVPDLYDDLPRVGVVLATAPGFTRLEWLGLGPFETYPDRRSAATVGRWRHDVSDEYVPYAMPQEHGLHLDTRWFTLVNDESRTGVLVQAVEPWLAFSASHCSADDLWRAYDTTDLVPRDETIVHVDVAHRGLGTLSCGPDTLPPYRVGPGEHRWRWRLRPYDGARERVPELLRQGLGSTTTSS
jgi:beta-galactosidase